MLGGFSARRYPRLLGYMETELKRGAHLDLTLPRDDRKPPLLASWRYEKGKSAAFTSDLEGHWTKNWIQWNSLQPFWDKVFGWLRPSDERALIPSHEVRVGLSDNQVLLELFVYEDINGDSQFRFSINGKTEGLLQKTAAGHYQGVLPLTDPGDYRIDLIEEHRGRRVTYPPVGYNLPYGLSAELPRSVFNLPLLNKIAQASGGEVNPQPSVYLKTPDFTAIYRPLRQPFIIWAGALFFLEVIARKLFFPATEARPARP
jgi:hypothetical protein